MHVYRDQLLDALAPLLELTEVDPRRLQSLRLQPFGIEIDLLPATVGDTGAGFKFVQIADRNPDDEEGS